MNHLEKKFKTEKCLSYRPLPFWSWNDRLDPKELRRQIRWMDDNGIGGYFMHARSGLSTEYLSEEWMDCTKACVEEGESRNMQNWLYDENGWPSGFAGGRLLEDEKNRDQYILHTIGPFDPDATISYDISGETLVRVQEGVADQDYLNLYIRIATSTADILNPDVVDQFIGLTHEAYKESFGEDFSKHIEGFFTDEPQYQRWNTPYTVMVRQYFADEYQEEIYDRLGLLFVEKAGYRKFRYRYWKAMQKLMLKNFAEKIYNWCEDNKVRLTGHYVEELTMGSQLMCCGGVMPFYEYEHIPGIDWLGKLSATLGPLSPLQVSSAARQMGKKQVLTETFGCCGWDVLPSEVKRIAGFQYVNGVNMMCHHLIPYSERGNRKYDYPAHYSDVNPWIREEFKTFNDYFTHLGYILGEGQIAVNTAVLHPLRSSYFDYKREEEMQGFGIRELEMATADTLKMLRTRGLDFHLLDETLLEKYGTAEGGTIGCGKCTYDYLILPDLITMDASTEKLIHRFVSQGGKILLLGKKPEYLEDEPYSYDYLASTCSLEDVLQAQPYRAKQENTDIYATYRHFDGTDYLYVINASEKSEATQTYDFGSQIHSFTRLDLTDMTIRQVPLTITLQSGEDALLIPSEKMPEEEKVRKEYALRFRDAQVSFDENYLVVDHLSYSTDGKEYSKLWPQPALFQKLIREQYKGRIFFRYEFEVETISDRMYLQAESNREVHAWLNGSLLTDRIPTQESYLNRYDISGMVREGKNEYIVETDWYEDPSVHYALYGENVTESLKNCISYDSELQPIWITGDFGVYAKSGFTDAPEPEFVQGDDFYIGSRPMRVSEPVTEGLPFFAGSVTLRQEVEFDTKDILLRVEGHYLIAEVTVNGQKAGKLLFGTTLDISEHAKAGKNEIEIRFVKDNRNLYGPHHLMNSNYESVSPWSFELFGKWEEDVSEFYHKSYDLRKLYTDK